MHNRRTIRAALAALKRNIKQKHFCTWIVAPITKKNSINLTNKSNTKKIRACGVVDTAFYHCLTNFMLAENDKTYSKYPLTP
jgi:hypothetical protein